MTSLYANRTTPSWPAIVVSALALPWCTGCPQMAITTAATTAASALVDDRSMAQQGADLDLKARIEKELLADAPSLAEAIDVDVYLGRVMLTGVVTRPSSRRWPCRGARDARRWRSPPRRRRRRARWWTTAPWRSRGRIST